MIASVLARKDQDLAATGWNVPKLRSSEDVQQLLGGEFERFCAVAFLDVLFV